MRHPALERLCLRLARAENQGIEAGFGNDGHFLHPAGGVDIIYTLFVFIQRRYGVAAVADVQTLANVLCHKPRLPILHDYAHAAKAGLFKNLNAVVHTFLQKNAPHRVTLGLFNPPAGRKFVSIMRGVQRYQDALSMPDSRRAVNASGAAPAGIAGEVAPICRTARSAARRPSCPRRTARQSGGAANGGYRRGSSAMPGWKWFRPASRQTGRCKAGRAR